MTYHIHPTIPTKGSYSTNQIKTKKYFSISIANTKSMTWNKNLGKPQMKNKILKPNKTYTRLKNPRNIRVLLPFKGFEAQIPSNDEHQTSAHTSAQRSCASFLQVPKKTSDRQNQPVRDRKAEIVHFLQLGFSSRKSKTLGKLHLVSLTDHRWEMTISQKYFSTIIGAWNSVGQ